MISHQNIDSVRMRTIKHLRCSGFQNVEWIQNIQNKSTATSKVCISQSNEVQTEYLFLFFWRFVMFSRNFVQGAQFTVWNTLSTKSDTGWSGKDAYFTINSFLNVK